MSVVDIPLDVEIRNIWTHDNHFTRAYWIGYISRMSEHRSSIEIIAVPYSISQEIIDLVKSKNGEVLSADRPYQGQYVEFLNLRVVFK